MVIHSPMVLRVEMMAIGRGNLRGRLPVFESSKSLQVAP